MSDKRQRQRVVGFRVSLEEEEQIRAAAERERFSVAGFLRHAALAASDGRRLALPGAELLALRTVTAEIQKIGLVTRKRAIVSEDADRVVQELRRVQRAILRWRTGETAP